jgi:hypothetical protein
VISLELWAKLALDDTYYFPSTRSTFAMSLWLTELVSPSSHEIVTSLQDVAITVP